MVVDRLLVSLLGVVTAGCKIRGSNSISEANSTDRFVGLALLSVEAELRMVDGLGDLHGNGC